MELRIERKYKKKGYTIGKLLINNEYFCDTLEDEVRDLKSDGSGKIYGETAIPKGVYKVVMNYSTKFKRVLPLVLSVPYFSGIRIHRGNKPEDTLGCVLVGENKVKGGLVNSTSCELRLCEKLKNIKEDIWLVIVE